MKPIGQLLVNDLDIVFFIYGLAFLIMGIAILVQPKKYSEHKIAGIFWLLAMFGITHGANEMFDMWAIIKGRDPVFDVLRWLVLIISYVFLFEFGRRFFRIPREKSPAWQKKTAVLLGWWLTPLIGATIFLSAYVSSDFWKVGSIMSRYLLGLPGGVLIGIGFLKEYQFEKEALEPLAVRKFFIFSGVAFLIYGLLGGLIVPKGDFFPSNILNTESFMSSVGVPVQVFRAACALAAAWSISGILRIFNWELRDKLQQRTDRLQSINRELETEINERKLAQEQIRSSLKEKEVLLKEIYHRTKNNMQVITSLLNLQSNQIDDPRYIDIFNESRNRISSMALVHEKLYRSRNLSSIDFQDYITSLANGLFTFYGSGSGKISFKIDAGGTILGIDTAIPCGLIINELISNSLKYAFPNGKQGSISITIKKITADNKWDNEYEMVISDDGIGIPEEIDIEHIKSLGLMLVNNLTLHQLRGNIELRRTGGTAFTIRFRELKYHDRL